MEKLPENHADFPTVYQILRGENRVVALLVEEQENARAADDDIAQKTVGVR